MEPANENTLAFLPRVTALGGQAGAIERVGFVSERVAELVNLKSYGEAAQKARLASIEREFGELIQRQAAGTLDESEVEVATFDMMGRLFCEWAAAMRAERLAEGVLLTEDGIIFADDEPEP